jgi:hypothetical protein
VAKHLGRLLASLCLVIPVEARATTWIVDVQGPQTSIQAAIDQAVSGDLVSVRAGTYYERLFLRDGVDVHAETPNSVIVDAESEGTAVTAIGISAATSIQDIRFLHGSAETGGGLNGIASSPVFNRCAFEASTAVLGGGVYLRDGSRPTFSNCTFAGNLAAVGGGLYLDFAAATLQNCVITNNEASFDGGALAASNAAEAAVNFTTINANRTGGATIACNLASPRFTNCTLVGNQAQVGCFDLRGSVTRIERCVVVENEGPAVVCTGFTSPWIGCSLFFGNDGDLPCAGDQGTNVFADPLFCNAAGGDYSLSENSPAATGSCGVLGALPIACPARFFEPPVQAAAWTQVKQIFRR